MGTLVSASAGGCGVILRAPWVTVDGFDGIFSPEKGVLAGVPLADVIFAITPNRITKAIQLQLLEHGLVSRVELSAAVALVGDRTNRHVPSSVVLSEVSIVDDVVYFISGFLVRFVSVCPRPWLSSNVSICDMVFSLITSQQCRPASCLS